MFNFKGRRNHQSGSGGKSRGGRSGFRPRRDHTSRGSKKGPADCTIPALKEHYFDCSGYNEADRFISTKKAIG